MSETLVKDSELAEYLKLPVTGSQLTLFLNDCGLMSVQYLDVPNGCEEVFAVHPDYDACNLGHILMRMKDKNGDLTPDWCWNERGCQVVLALFKKLQPRDCHEITKEVVCDTLDSIAGGATSSPASKFNREQ
ncbi:MAG: hypothetical protein NT118_05130, partial [Lentisphaerae bacterium]|nr:hypothetical protein [Lentisphaerota bacterium]